MYVVVFAQRGGVALQRLTAAGEPEAPAQVVHPGQLVSVAGRLELERRRWVWDDTSRWYPLLLAAGVRVERCIDLRLCHAILRNSALTSDSRLAAGPVSSWDREALEPNSRAMELALFSLDEAGDGVDGNFGGGAGGYWSGTEDSLAEFAIQREAQAGAAEPGRLGLLLAAESAGALVAAEILHAGLPWRADIHDQILEHFLGPRPAPGQLPKQLEAAMQRVRLTLEAPNLNPDSPPELLGALANAGLGVSSTRAWELSQLKHPAIEPLLQYKKLSRLLVANGWRWLDANVRGGRFYPEYVPGGVVTGRWASKGGGGVLQLPKQIRGAVVADPGWKFVVADASQLEPRILAALSGDRAMMTAASQGDLYAAIVASGAVETREQAKVAMLGAMYGATSGESGRLMPRLTAAFPLAIALVEQAARAGERGEVVTTRLGRSSPRPPAAWLAAQADAYGEGAGRTDPSRARNQARSWGRFTRNFIVQGSAAEWALCWMASIRRGLKDSPGLTGAAHLVLFMHDEVVVHCPAADAGAVEETIRSAAEEAGRLMFGGLPVTFPLTVAIVDNYGQAK